MKLTTVTMVTVDGVMQGLGGPDEDRRGGFERGGWVTPLSDNDAETFLNQVYQRADAFLHPIALRLRNYLNLCQGWLTLTQFGAVFQGGSQMRRVLVRRGLLLLGLVSLLVGPFSGSPVASAATSEGLAVFCGDAVAAAAYDNLARGGSGVDREPALNDTPAEVPDSAKGKGGPRFRATVDVYFHVVSDGATGNVSDTAIAQQIAVMNAGYSGQEGGVDTGFRFKLASVDRTDNTAWYNAGPGTSEERDMKRALHQGTASDLNYYSTTAGVYLGWAYFPSTYKSRPWIDGIVVDWESMLGTSPRYAGAYDLGKTATHEAGHWVGLYHTFQGGCNHWGDHVDDTPPMLVPTRGCPEGKDTCSEPGLDPIHNYMDYSYDSCYNQFTAGQTARMQDQWLFYRANGGA